VAVFNSIVDEAGTCTAKNVPWQAIFLADLQVPVNLFGPDRTMSGNSPDATKLLLEREKSRLVDELRAASAAASAATDMVKEIAAKLETIDRDLADYDRIASKYKNPLSISEPVLARLAAIAAPAPPRSFVGETQPGVLTGATLSGLVDVYRSTENSPYKDLRHKTREHYDTVIKKLLKTCGSLKVAEITADDIQRAYSEWTENGTTKLGMAHALITMLRVVVNFGLRTFNDPACDRLSVVLHRMRFAGLKTRNERLSKVQAEAIIKRAHALGLPSAALAQAFQFDCGLRQKDVLGEWLPEKEPGESEVKFGGEKWLRGLRWEEIDEDLTLKHLTGVDEILVTRPLRDAPLVMQELARFGERPKHGPIIVSERTGRPWSAQEFRRTWRKMASDCGIPPNVKNMDSRIGAVDAEKYAANSDEPKLRLVK
jgi:hypothetical protein